MANLFVPSVEKFAHIFAHHQHTVCEGGSSTHIHKVDYNCEFHKFHLNKNFSFSNFTFNVFIEKDILLEIVSQYNFISEFQRLQVSLRGPPALI
ncbi:hypothetical protein ACFFU1_07355 [Algibacter miyuki]|uniref:Uncharacterized protein n=1 Tax=Algibacter miyuki TaxID=1306933 RepID=A0ABV5GZ28_9FLAO|nr:hypothetical protein [Algibacter miyuki]MDN3667093.1 hypothetical protein [Algibacter miyuki]